MGVQGPESEAMRMHLSLRVDVPCLGCTNTIRFPWKRSMQGKLEVHRLKIVLYGAEYHGCAPFARLSEEIIEESASRPIHITI